MLNTVKDILAGAAGLRGHPLFSYIVAQTARALDADYAFLGELAPTASPSDIAQIQTLSFIHRDTPLSNLRYSTSETPCEKIVKRRKAYSISSGVAARYPNAQLLKGTETEAYVGVPLLDSEGSPIGVMAVLYKQRQQDTETVSVILHLLSLRAGIELERRRIRSELIQSETAYRAAVGGHIEKEREARYRALLVGIPDLMFRISQDGTFIDYHTDHVEQLAMPADRIIGSKVKDSPLPPDISNALLKCLADCIETDEIQSMEYTLDMQDTTLHYEARIIKSGAREAVAVVRNITKEKQTEAEKDRLREELRHSEKMQAIGQLASGIAHDFNNQLAGIVGYADLIAEQDSPNPEMKEYAEKIITAGRRLADLNQQLLAFARKGRNLEDRVDLHVLIDDVISLLRHAIDKRIVIRKSLTAKQSVVHGDSSQLQSAFVNLAVNARDAMPDGGEINIVTQNTTLDKTQEHPAGTYIKIDVIDSGTGIEEKNISRIFEPFFSTKKAGKGLGMGLAAVYGTVQSHDGLISVQSSMDGGTTFEVLLPTATEAAPRAQTSSSAIADGKGGGKGHILFVDDEETVRDVGSVMLQRLGYEVTTCSDGEEGVSIYRERWQKFDMVVLDSVMPSKSGKETLLEMKQINPAIRVLLSSGYSLNEKVQEILALGARQFIQKPFVKSELFNKIQATLNDD